MTKVKIFKSIEPTTLESEINSFLELKIKNEIIDIKYSATNNGAVAIYSALVIYR